MEICLFDLIFPECVVSPCLDIERVPGAGYGNYRSTWEFCWWFWKDSRWFCFHLFLLGEWFSSTCAYPWDSWGFLFIFVVKLNEVRKIWWLRCYNLLIINKLENSFLLQGAVDLLMHVYKKEFKKIGGYLVDLQRVIK